MEQMITQITGEGVDATARVGGQAGAETQSSIESKTAAGKSSDGGANRYRGAQGLPPELIKQIEKQFGLDKPIYERFLLMMGNYIKFDFGNRSIETFILILKSSVGMNLVRKELDSMVYQKLYFSSVSQSIQRTLKISI